MTDTLTIGLLLVLNAMTCIVTYLIGEKAGLHRGYLLARASRLRAEAK